MIRFLDISKHYIDTFRMHNFNLDIITAETTVFIGSSGSGKSTLLKLILGLIWPDLGKIEIDNQFLTKGSIIELRKKMGYVVQSGGLFPHLTARQNIVLMASYLKKDKDWINSRLLNLVDLTHFPVNGLDRYPKELSGGQQQRVSLMRALMLDPEYLLLDEPLSALDPIIKSELQFELKEIFVKLKKTVVFVTHDIVEAAYFGNEVVLLNHGKIVQKGTMRELINNPINEFVSKFVLAQSQLLELIK